MALSAQDKARVRYHMGYPQVTQAQTFVVGGVPAPMELNFLIEGAMNKIAPESEGTFRGLLDKLDGIEAQMIQDQPNIAAKQVGNVTPNQDEFKQLIYQYQYWQGQLSNMLAVPVNPFDKRFAAMGINCPVA